VLEETSSPLVDDADDDEVSSVSSSDVSLSSSDDEAVEVDDWGEPVPAMGTEGSGSGGGKGVVGMAAGSRIGGQAPTPSIDADEMREIMRSLGVKLTDDEIQGADPLPTYTNPFRGPLLMPLCHTA